VLLSEGSTSDSLALEDNLLRLAMPDRAQTAVLASRIVLHSASVVIVYRNDSYGQTFAASLQDRLRARDYDAVQLLAYSPNLDNIDDAKAQVTDPLLAMYDQQEFEGVVVVAFDEIAYILGALASDESYSPLTDLTWYGTDGIAQSISVFGTPEARILSEQMGLYSYIYTGDRFYPNEERDAYVAYFITQTGKTPPSYLVNILDILEVLHDTCTLAINHSVTFEQLAPYLLHTSDFGFGYSGVLALDDNGDRRSGTYALYRVRDSAIFGPESAWQQISEIVTKLPSTNDPNLLKRTRTIKGDEEDFEGDCRWDTIMQARRGGHMNSLQNELDVSLATWIPTVGLRSAYGDVEIIQEEEVIADFHLTVDTGLMVCPVSRYDAERTFTIQLNRQEQNVSIRVLSQSKLNVLGRYTMQLESVTVDDVDMDLTGAPPVYYMALPIDGQVNIDGPFPEMVNRSWGTLVEWATTVAIPYKRLQTRC